MIRPVEIEMAPLAQRGKVLWPHVRFVALVARPAVGMGYAKMRDTQHDHSAGYVVIACPHTTPLAATPSALLTNLQADRFPVVRVVGVELAHG